MAYKNREDQRAYGRQHYLDNKEKYLATSAEQRKKQIADRRARVSEYLDTHPCVDCGESDKVVLDFDHIDPATKVDNISRMVRARLTWPKLLAEIEKCEVRCANCHRRRTAIQFGWG